MGKFLRYGACILAILGGIVSFIIANALGTFNFAIFLLYLLSELAVCILIYAIGTILINQEEIMGFQKQLSNKLDKLSSATAAQAINNNPAPVPVVDRPHEPEADPEAPKIVKVESFPVRPRTTASPRWICKICKSENPSSRKSCLNCGAPK